MFRRLPTYYHISSMLIFHWISNASFMFRHLISSPVEDVNQFILQEVIDNINCRGNFQHASMPVKTISTTCAAIGAPNRLLSQSVRSNRQLGVLQCNSSLVSRQLPSWLSVWAAGRHFCLRGCTRARRSPPASCRAAHGHALLTLPLRAAQ